MDFTEKERVKTRSFSFKTPLVLYDLGTNFKPRNQTFIYIKTITCMAQATQFFFSIEKLRELLKAYDNDQIVFDGRTLRGFVFTVGVNPETNEPGVFPFPLYTMQGKSTTEDAVLVQNLSMTYSGCPYPPPCN